MIKNFTLKLWDTMKNKMLPLQNWEQTLDTVYENSKNIIKSSTNYLEKILRKEKKDLKNPLI